MQPLLTAFMLFGVKPYIIALANITFPNTQENTFGIIVGGKKRCGLREYLGSHRFHVRAAVGGGITVWRVWRLRWPPSRRAAT